AWDAFFTLEHMETIARRHARVQTGRPEKAVQYLMEFLMLFKNEGVHPLEGGILRRKRRRSRRPTLPREPALVFYPRLAFETGRKVWRYWRGFRKAKAIVRKVQNDPARWDYMDTAIAPL